MPGKCSTTASAMNATVNNFIERKKLKLSHKKCCAIHVGKPTGSCPKLKVHDKPIHRENSTKYLGDIFHTNGNGRKTRDRQKRILKNIIGSERETIMYLCLYPIPLKGR